MAMSRTGIEPGDEHPRYDELVHEAANYTEIAVHSSLVKAKAGFEHALDAIKKGHCVARAGWNGKGMWLQMGRVTTMISVGQDQPLLGDSMRLICMKTAQDTLVPWLASVTDLMAEDWEVLP